MGDAGKYAVLAHPGASPQNLTGYRYRSVERAQRALAQLADRFPRAVVAYTPTKAQEQQWAKEGKRVQSFALKWFRVSHKSGRTVNAPLSPMYLDRAQAERALARCKLTEPGAELWEYESFFHPDSSEDHKDRDRLLTMMAPLEH